MTVAATSRTRLVCLDIDDSQSRGVALVSGRIPATPREIDRSRPGAEFAGTGRAAPITLASDLLATRG